MWTGDIRKADAGRLERRESRTLISVSIHNTQMCLLLKPVFSRDRRGLPNFMDEPTTGLDPEERIRIRNLLVDFSENRTVLFSTHVVEDLAATCNQLANMHKGRFLYAGSMKNLTEEVTGENLGFAKYLMREKQEKWNRSIVLHQNSMLRGDCS